MLGNALTHRRNRAIRFVVLELRRFTVGSKNDDAGEWAGDVAIDVGRKAAGIKIPVVVERRDNGRINAGKISFHAIAIATYGRRAPCNMRFAANTTAKIATAGAKIHGNRVITLISAASASIVPHVGTSSGKPRPT